MWCMLSSAMLLNVHPIRTYKKQYGDYILYVHICTVKSQVFFFGHLGVLLLLFFMDKRHAENKDGFSFIRRK